jgi:thiol-disulfide isomerase/thioredoxin
MTMLRFAHAIVAAAVLTASTASAQIPPDRNKPVLMQPKDTLKQFFASPTPDYEVGKDPKNERVVFKGLFAYADMIDEPTFSWLTTGMEEYAPNKEAVQFLKANLNKYTLFIAVGTWCGDSKDLLPKLFRVLQDAGLSHENILMAGLDRDKTTFTKEGKKAVRKYKIKLLPTFVVLDGNGHEVGRIEESVNKSVEEDLMAIIGKK